MTNSSSIHAAFDQKFCGDDHPHQRIEGSEGAQRRSLLAQVYPDQMVNTIASAVMADAASATGF